MPDERRTLAANEGTTGTPKADAVSAPDTDAAHGADAAPVEAPADPPAGVARAARSRRGMLSDDLQYAVYLHPGALETLGETIAPFLTHGPHGPHLVCTDFDTAGALAEMTVDVLTSEGAHQRTEVMFPVAMIRLVVSIGGLVDGFGFRTRG